jgi:hypothetical protein
VIFGGLYIRAAHRILENYERICARCIKTVALWFPKVKFAYDPSGVVRRTTVVKLARGRVFVTSILFLLLIGPIFGLVGCGGASESEGGRSQAAGEDGSGRDGRTLRRHALLRSPGRGGFRAHRSRCGRGGDGGGWRGPRQGILEDHHPFGVSVAGGGGRDRLGAGLGRVRGDRNLQEASRASRRPCRWPSTGP